MLEQLSFSDLDFQHKRRRTRREEFLDRLEALVPWERLEGVIRPHYPKAGQGRRPYSLSVMLRVHVVQVCHNLSDPAMEDLLYDSRSVQQFVGLRLSEPIPDESTILHFRHLLEKHQLGQGLFEEIKACLEEQGIALKEGTIVDATIIQAPSSTKNREGKRDPEMRQTRKGKQYYFGMKAHIGVDAETGMVHSLVTTGANVHDVTPGGGTASWEGTASVGRCGLHGSGETGGEQGVGGGMAGGAETREAEAAGAGGLGGVVGKDQGIGAGQGGTPFSRREANIRL